MEIGMILMNDSSVGVVEPVLLLGRCFRDSKIIDLNDFMK